MAAKIFFGIIRIVVKVAPLGAFGAMAFTVGSQGLGALKSLGYLMFCFYLTAGLFRRRRPGIDCRFQRFLDFPLSQLYQRRSFFSCSVRAPRKPRCLECSRKCSGSSAPLPPSDWSFRPATASTSTAIYLHDNGSGIPSPGDQHSSGSWATTCSSGRRDAFIQRRRRRYRRRFHHARSDTLGGAIRSDRVSGYPGRHRPIHE